MKIRRLNENIEWSTYKSRDADEHLRMIFTDFIEPMNPDKKSSIVRRAKAGHDMMAAWILEIPFSQIGLNIDKYLAKINDLLEELNSCIKKTKLDMPNIKHNIKINTDIDKDTDNVILTIWND